MTGDPGQTEPLYDLLLSGGYLIDPDDYEEGLISSSAATSIPRKDVAVRDGKIALVTQNIPASHARQVVDVSGLYVTPGILDIHTHVYPFIPSPDSYVESVVPDAHLLASGVTTTVDAGTAGWEHFLDFKAKVIERAKVRVLAFLNIARRGMVDARSEQNMDDMQPGLVASLASTYPDLIVGIKSAHYWTKDPWDAAHAPWASVDRALEAAHACQLPVMVDFWPRPPQRSYRDLVLNKLRPGDIHTHVFAQQFPIVNEQHQVTGYLFEARSRGVLFDLGHGAASFWYRNAVPALQGGFPPDTISTDLHMANINGPVLSMQNTMSKMLNMGMPLAEVIWRSTARPAQIIHRPELGRLSVGSGADLAVFKLHEGSFRFADCGRARLDGTYRLENQLTLRDGTIVFDPSGLSMPEWQAAPPSYWINPAL